MEILVFKTNLSNQQHISKVKPALDLHSQIIQWNVDLQDCDKVLRLVSDKIPAPEIETLISNAGIFVKSWNKFTITYHTK